MPRGVYERKTKEEGDIEIPTESVTRTVAEQTNELAQGGVVRPGVEISSYQGEPEFIAPIDPVADILKGNEAPSPVPKVVLPTAESPPMQRIEPVRQEPTPERVKQAMASAPAPEPKAEPVIEQVPTPPVAKPKAEPMFNTLAPERRVEAPPQMPQMQNRMPLRDMNLDNEQMELLIKEQVKKIVTEPNRLEGGLIPAVISEDGSRCDTLANFMPATGGTRHFLLMEIDYRVLQKAYTFYKDNAIKPTHQGFLDVLGKATGKNGKIYHRVVPWTLQ